MDEAPPAPEFHLTAVAVPASRDGAAAFYAVAPKTITRWSNMGRAAKDPCPLRDPAAMPDWWARVSRKPVDERILAAAAKVAGRPDVPPDVAPPAAPSLPALDMSQFNPQDYNYDSSLMAARVVMMAQQQLLTEAFNTGDESRRRKALADFSDAAESLRRLEKDSGKIQQQQGLTLRRDEVRAALVQIHQHIPARFKSALRHFLSWLANLPDPEILMLLRNPSERDLRADSTVDSACADLAANNFSDSLLAA